MFIRKTTQLDITAVMEIYAFAQGYMKDNNNPNQWGDVHPPQALIEEDVKAGHSYVCVDGDKILAVFYFNIECDPTYNNIEGSWLNDEPYGVVHRIARGPDAKGAGAFCLNWCFTQYPNIRIDTHRANLAMLKLLEKLGFEYCGVIWLDFADGCNEHDERVAFQKI